MSYNDLINVIMPNNEVVPKNDSLEQQKVILSREEKLDKFLESTVVDKFKQKWKDLTPFLRTNRIKLYVEETSDNSEEVEKQFISIRAEILDYNSFHPEDTTYENRTINKIILAAPMNQLILDKKFKVNLSEGIYKK